MESINNSILITGAGGMARETYQIYKNNGRAGEVLGFIINTSKIQSTVFGKRVYELEDLGKLKNVRKIISGIGSPLRKYLITCLLQKKYLLDTIIDNTAQVGYNVKIGKGSVICTNTVLTCDISVGNNVIVGNGSIISHDDIIEDYTTVTTGVRIGGRVTIGRESFIGIGSTIVNDITIGKNCFIGGGSVVVKNVPDNTLAYGNPAKNIRLLTEKLWRKLI